MKTKVLFEIIKEACYEDLGVQLEQEIKDDSFLIEELDEDLFYLHTDKFVARAECVLHILDQDSDRGEWYKEYIIEEISKLYDKTEIGLDKITEFIKKIKR